MSSYGKQSVSLKNGEDFLFYFASFLFKLGIF